MIVNDVFWKDIDGNFIYSQGGGIFKFGDTYYWYGVHYKGAEIYAINPDKKNSDFRFVSITCYSSKDLINWKFENDVITPKTENWGEPNWVGRMGVAYCSSTRQYVLVTQYGQGEYKWNNGDSKGSWKNDMIDGEVVFIYSNGKMKSISRWI